MWRLGLSKTVGSQESNCGAVGVLPASAFRLIYGNLVTARRAMSGRLKSWFGWIFPSHDFPYACPREKAHGLAALGRLCL